MTEQTTSQRIATIAQHLTVNGEIYDHVNRSYTKAVRTRQHPTSGSELIEGLMRTGRRGYRWLWIADAGLRDLERCIGIR